MVAFSVSESVKQLVKNNSYIDLSSLQKATLKTTQLDAVEGQMGSMSSRMDDLTSALDQV